jgi:hypothetical protein
MAISGNDPLCDPLNCPPLAFNDGEKTNKKPPLYYQETHEQNSSHIRARRDAEGRFGQAMSNTKTTTAKVGLLPVPDKNQEAYVSARHAIRDKTKFLFPDADTTARCMKKRFEATTNEFDRDDNFDRMHSQAIDRVAERVSRSFQSDRQVAQAVAESTGTRDLERFWSEDMPLLNSIFRSELRECATWSFSESELAQASKSSYANRTHTTIND